MKGFGSRGFGTKKRMRRFQEGGMGYEEDPKPGKQSDKKSSDKKSGSGAASSRRVSSMEFIKKYEASDPSKRIKDEASTEVKKSREDKTPGRQFSGTYGETREALSSLSPEQKKEALKAGVSGAAAMLPVGRIARGLKTAKRRYDIGKRVDAMTEGQQKGAFLKAAREAKEVDGMRKGGSVGSASKRADGIAQRGKTRGKMC